MGSKQLSTCEQNAINYCHVSSLVTSESATWVWILFKKSWKAVCIFNDSATCKMEKNGSFTVPYSSMNCCYRHNIEDCVSNDCKMSNWEPNISRKQNWTWSIFHTRTWFWSIPLSAVMLRHCMQPVGKIKFKPVYVYLSLCVPCLLYQMTGL